MNVEPLKSYREPKYPTREEVMDNPDILKLVPDRWKGNMYVKIALSALLACSLAGCSDNRGGDENNSAKKALVAPVFDHGSGRGSFGCVSVAPPAFLSEEEAFQVIQEEARDFGITFETRSPVLKGAKIPETKYHLETGSKVDEILKGRGKIDSTRSGELKLDGYDEKNKIGFEFVSKDDYDAWKIDEKVRSSVDQFDFLSTAKLLREGIEGKNEDSSIGVFYNPMTILPREELISVKDEKDWAKIEMKTKEMAKQNLKEQVKDFLNWLKAEGII